jgi:hypothetical protein
MPVTAPIRAGHTVELNFPRTLSLAKRKGGFARIKAGKGVRIERNTLMDDAAISVGIAFSEIEA